MMDTFTTIQNETLCLHPITVRDGKKLLRWIQYKPLFDFQEMRDQFPQEAYDKEYARLLEQCNSKRIHEGSPEVEEALRTNEGGAYFVYLSVAHKHPQITLDQIQDGLTPSRLLEVFQQVLILSGMVAKKNEAATDLPPLIGTKSTVAQDKQD